MGAAHMAANRESSSSSMVSITTSTSGWSARTRRVASMPFMSAIWMSIRTTSGSVSAIRASARPGPGLLNHLGVFGGGQQRDQPFAKQRAIVDDEHAQRTGPLEPCVPRPHSGPVGPVGLAASPWPTRPQPDQGRGAIGRVAKTSCRRRPGGIPAGFHRAPRPSRIDVMPMPGRLTAWRPTPSSTTRTSSAPSGNSSQILQIDGTGVTGHVGDCLSGDPVPMTSTAAGRSPSGSGWVVTSTRGRSLGRACRPCAVRARRGRAVQGGWAQLVH